MLGVETSVTIANLVVGTIGETAAAITVGVDRPDVITVV